MLRVAAVVLAGLFMCTSLQGGEPRRAPVRSDDTSFQPGTQAWEFAQRERFFASVVVAPFLKRIDRAQPWAERASTSLGVEAHRLAHGESKADVQTRRANYDALRGLGCNDPTVAFFALIADAESRHALDSGIKLLQYLRSKEGELQHPALALHAGVVALEHARFFNQEDHKLLAFERIVRACGELILGGAGDYERRLRLAEMSNVIFDVMEDEQQRPILDQLFATENTDPWILHVLLGSWQVEEAWRRRGGAYASETSDKQMIEFLGHLTHAEKWLMLAHEAEPQNPEAATKLITVSMGLGERGKHTTRYWFDQVQRVYFEWPQAYSAYLQDLLPRWHGSHEQMLQFASECADTGRFDTRVPMYMIDVLARLADDFGDMVLIWQAPMLYDEARHIAVTTAENATLEGSRHMALSKLAGMAYRAERPDDVRFALEQLGDDFAPEGALLFHLRHEDLLSMALLGVPGTVGTKTRDAVYLISGGLVDEALAKLDEALMECSPADSLAREGLQNLRYLVEYSGRLNEQDWTDFPFEQGLPGWRLIIGRNAKVFGGSLYLEPSEDGALIVLGRPIGSRYEAKVVVDSSRFWPKDWGNGGFAYWFNEDGPHQLYRTTQLYYPGSNVMFGFRFDSSTNVDLVDLNGANELHLKVWDDMMAIHVNGRLVYAGPAGSDSIPFDVGELGLAIRTKWAAGSTSFSNLQVRLLGSIPEEIRSAIGPIDIADVAKGRD